VLRVARASSDLAQAHRFYCVALGLQRVGAFTDHDGFDGLIVGEAGAGWHLELVHEHGARIGRRSPEDLIVLYEPRARNYQSRVARMRGAGCAPVRSSNPYWDRNGMTFEDHDGYRTVIAHLRWAR